MMKQLPDVIDQHQHPKQLDPGHASIAIRRYSRRVRRRTAQLRKVAHANAESCSWPFQCLRMMGPLTDAMRSSKLTGGGGGDVSGDPDKDVNAFFRSKLTGGGGGDVSGDPDKDVIGCLFCLQCLLQV
ncbi:hypothetical protein QE152_g39207 [Popillia japonica]|uniref:Uncharacterized protein n=1 Tax=Popillia japonica TaxID=7064 RepID=A0AAW1HUB0_POPJA